MIRDALHKSFGKFLVRFIFFNNKKNIYIFIVKLLKYTDKVTEGNTATFKKIKIMAMW